MARMIPNLDLPALKSIRSKAERDVYTALRDGLPNELVVVHSFEFIRPRDAGVTLDGEADFVVFDPTRGFLVIEVKGGGIEVDRERNQWYSTDRNSNRHKIKDPFWQAKQNKYATLKTMQDAFGHRPPRWLIGHAALLPDLMDGVSRLVSPSSPREIMGSRPDLKDVHKWIEGVFDYWQGQATQSEPLGPQGMAAVERIFANKIQVKAPLSIQIENEAEVFFDLTESQARILWTLRRHHRAVIAGGAGTGKTLLAISQAKMLAERGLNTLLVCYNTVLGDFLKRECEGTENLHAMTVHQLCSWRVRTIERAKGVDLTSQAKADFPGKSWQDVQLPYAAANSVEHDSFQYQAIVVDEGQDFSEELWMATELLLDDFDKSFFYIFMDANQAIYRGSSSIPISDTPYLLEGNCRNTRPIHEAAYAFYRGERVEPPHLPGEPLEWLECNGADKQVRAIRKRINLLLNEEKIDPEDIAVLVWSGKMDTFAKPALLNAGQPTGAQWSFQRHWQSGCVLVDSVRRFKGMEASVVLLWLDEPVHPTDSEDQRKLYVALSRPRNRMWIVGSGLKELQDHLSATPGP